MVQLLLLVWNLSVFTTPVSLWFLFSFSMRHNNHSTSVYWISYFECKTCWWYHIYNSLEGSVVTWNLNCYHRYCKVYIILTEFLYCRRYHGKLNREKNRKCVGDNSSFNNTSSFLKHYNLIVYIRFVKSTFAVETSI